MSLTQLSEKTGKRARASNAKRKPYTLTPKTETSNRGLSLPCQRLVGNEGMHCRELVWLFFHFQDGLPADADIILGIVHEHEAGC